MAQSQKLITNSYRLTNARNFINSFGEYDDNQYYFFVSYDETVSTIPVPYDNVKDTLWDTYRNMLFGKKIASTDVKLSIPRYTYSANVVYAMYDDTDTALYDKKFYVMVPDGSFTHVFKCMSNLDGETFSTVSPSIAHVGVYDEVYETSDGYQWKYMYTADSSTISKFATATYFPYVENTSVTAAAVDGTINVIKVEDEGSGYFNYFSGTFRTQDIKLGGNGLHYGISNSVMTGNGVYKGCYVYITDGPAGIVGQYKKIVDSRANGSSYYIVLESEFSANADNTTKYEIYPAVEIIGDGTQTVNAAAVAIINSSSSNTIYKIKMLELGAGYKYATAVVNSVATSSGNGFRAATVRPILPPAGGHGSDVADELGSKYISVGVSLANTEGNTIIASNDYRQIGIMKNPLFANVKLNFSNSVGTFLVNENAFNLNTTQMKGTISVNSTSTTVVGTNTVFDQVFAVNDYIYMISADLSSKQLGQVNSVTNSTVLQLKNLPLFISTNSTFYTANVIGSGKVIQVGVNTITLDRVKGQFSSTNEVIGRNTGATGVVNSVSRSNQVKNFNTFIQMHSYDGTITAGGSFTNDEIVRMTNDPTVGNAIFHAISTVNGTPRMYVNKQTGIFNVGGTNSLTGATSGSVFALNNKYYPEIVYGTGEILYVENIDPVTRLSDQTETFKLILEF